MDNENSLFNVKRSEKVAQPASSNIFPIVFLSNNQLDTVSSVVVGCDDVVMVEVKFDRLLAFDLDLSLF